jgi:hypothetical protein
MISCATCPMQRRGRASRSRASLHLELLEDRKVPAQITWICDDGDWATPGCWDPKRLPQSGDDVVIVRPGAVTVTHSTGTSQVSSLSSEERLVLTGGTIAPANPSVVEGVFEQTGGTFFGGDLTINGPFTWTAGAQRGPGQTTANGGMMLTGPSLKGMDRTLNNAGAATWTGPGGLWDFFQRRQFNNLAGASLEIQGTGTMLSGGISLINDGLVQKTGSGTCNFIEQTGFTNNGGVGVLGGSLFAQGASAGGTGIFYIAASATLGLHGAGTALAQQAFVLGEGSLSISADVASIRAPIHIEGDLTLGPSLGIDLFSPTIYVGGRISAVAGGQNNFRGSRVSAGSVLLGAGSLTLRHGAGLDAGDITVSGGASFNVASDSWAYVFGYYIQIAGMTSVLGYLGAVEAVWIQAGTLSGTGVVDANVWNQGRVAPGAAQATGTLTIGGYYWQDGSGRLAVRLGGTAAGAYDQLVIVGDAYLAGELTVTLFRDFEPQAGDSFVALNSRSLNGTAFTTYNLPVLSGGLRLEPVLDDSSVHLITVSAGPGAGESGKGENPVGASLWILLRDPERRRSAYSSYPIGGFP